MNRRSKLRRSAATLTVLLAAALAAPGRGAAQQDGDAEDTRTSSQPRSCLAHPTIRRTKILNDRNIVFVTRNDTIYNNELPKQCHTLRRNSLVNYGIQNGRICTGDRFQLLMETSPGNYTPASLCELGSFREISAAELDDLVAMTEENRAERRRGRSRREAVTTEQVELPRTEAAPAPAETAPAE